MARLLSSAASRARVEYRLNQERQGRMQMSLSAEDSLLDIQLSPSLRELQLSLGLETLREIAYSLVTQVNCIARLDPKTVAKVDLHEAVKRFEIEIIRTALEKASGNQAKAARMLGVKHTTLN